MIMIIILSGLLHLAIAQSVVDVHVGMAAQFTGSWKVYGEVFMDVEDFVMDWFAREKDSTYGGTQYNLIWHHFDYKSDPDYLAEHIVDFVLGKFDTQNQDDWDYNDRNRLPAGTGKGVEPAPSKLDALCIGMGMVPAGLQALKDAGIRIPSYSYGMAGIEANMNADGSARWDMQQSAMVLADQSVGPAVSWGYRQGARTVFLLQGEADNVYSISLMDGARNTAVGHGMAYKQADLVFLRCGDIDKTGAERIAWQECVAKNEKMVEDAFGDSLYSGKRYSADMLVVTSNGHYCKWLPDWLKKKNYNFRMLIGSCGVPTEVAEEVWENHLKEVPYLSDYWTNYEYTTQAASIFHDYNFGPPEVNFFGECGPASPKCMQDAFMNLRGGKGHKVGGWIEAMAITPIRMMLHDLSRSEGNPSNMIKFMGVERPPITTVWGLVGNTPGGWNPGFYQDPASMKYPAHLNEGKEMIIAPDQVAIAEGLYPCPLWTKRECEDKCVKCPKCSVLEDNLYMIIGLISVPFILGVFCLIGRRLQKTFDVFSAAFSLLYGGMFAINIFTDVCAILLLMFQVEEEIIDPSWSTYLYTANATLGAFFGAIRTRISFNVAKLYYNGFCKDDYHVVFSMMLDSHVMTMSMPFDIMICGLQIYTIFVVNYSDALLISLVLTSMTVGFSGNAVSTKHSMIMNIHENLRLMNKNDTLEIFQEESQFSLLKHALKKNLAYVPEADKYKRKNILAAADDKSEKTD